MRIFLICLLLADYLSAFSQTRVITGKVKDDKGDTIPFTTVYIKATKRGTITDTAGNYRITVPISSTDTIYFSSIGYENMKIVIGKYSTIDVILTRLMFELEMMINASTH